MVSAADSVSRSRSLRVLLQCQLGVHFRDLSVISGFHGSKILFLLESSRGFDSLRLSLWFVHAQLVVCVSDAQESDIEWCSVYVFSQPGFEERTKVWLEPARLHFLCPMLSRFYSIVCLHVLWCLSYVFFRLALRQVPMCGLI